MYSAVICIYAYGCNSSLLLLLSYSSFILQCPVTPSCNPHREVLQEKTKVSALSEELENPMNVHRWRKLEGTYVRTCCCAMVIFFHEMFLYGKFLLEYYYILFYTRA
jgi:hypothetical protein